MYTKEELNLIVFGTETKIGKRFDIILLWIILLSVLVVILDSVPELHANYKSFFYALEWILTIIFTLEYALRVYISPKPLLYIFGIWGFIDIVSILPTYMSFFLEGAQYLIVVRIFRVLRVFRILKLFHFVREARIFALAIKSSFYKIGLFFMSVLFIVTVLGAIMYVVEHGENGFTSIPQGMYWAIVTVTTVGFGDVVPSTILGKFISSFAMLVGYSIIAIPTGIITVGIAKASTETKVCSACRHDNPKDAHFCNNCGKPLNV